MAYKREGYKVKRIYFDGKREILLNEIEPFAVIPLHYHKVMTEVFVFDKNVIVKFRGCNIPIKANEVSVIRPFEKHSIINGSKKTKLIVVRFPYKAGDRYTK